MPEISKMKYQNLFPEPGTTISGFADSKKNCYKYNKLQKKNILSFHNLVIATRG
jgi:hypothetical protein